MGVIFKLITYMFETICGRNFSSSISGALGGEKLNQLLNNTDVGGVGYLYDNVFLPVGVGLLVIYLLVDIMTKVSSDHFNNKMVLQSLLRFVIIYIVMRNARYIFDLFMQLTTAMAQNLDKKSNIFAESYDSNIAASILESKFAASGVWGTIMSFLHAMALTLSMLVGYGLAEASLLICLVVAATRNIELTAYIVASPMALANMVGPNIEHSGAMRYLKKVIALILQAVVIMVIVLAINSLSIDAMKFESILDANRNAISTPLTSENAALVMYNFDFSAFISGVIYRVAGAFLILKSTQMANDIVG